MIVLRISCKCKRGRKSKLVTWDVDERGCWICTSHSLSTQGYPQKWFRGRLWKLSRVVWTENFGEIPDYKYVLYKCRNKLCINPDHLFIRSPGTRRGEWDEV
jgi:hypothetical protein